MQTDLSKKPLKQKKTTNVWSVVITPRVDVPTNKLMHLTLLWSFYLFKLGCRIFCRVKIVLGICLRIFLENLCFSRGDSGLGLTVMPNIDLAHRLFEDPIEHIWQSVLLNADVRRVFQKTNISSNFQQNFCLFFFQHFLLKHPEIIRKLF